MAIREHRGAVRRLIRIGASVVLLAGVASCSATNPDTQTVTSITGPPPVDAGPSTTTPAATTTVADLSAGWSFSSAAEPSSRGGSWCVRLTNAGQTAATCLSVPGVQRMRVGGAQFALTRGTPLRFDGGEVVAIDAAEAAPSTAWMIVRCAPDKAAVVQFNLPDERAGFLERTGTTWRVVHVTAATDACRTVPAVADICSSVAL